MASGAGLYSAPPGFVVHGYPPLSFYLVNAVAKCFSSALFAGRFLAAIGLLLTAVFSGGIVLALTRRWAPSIMGFLLVLIAIALYAPDYVAIHDPSLIALAIVLAGVLLYFRSESAACTAASAAMVASAIFFKHSVLVFPTVIALALLVKDRRRFLIWLGAFLGTSAIWAAFCFARHGPYFLDHLWGPIVLKDISITLAMFERLVKILLFAMAAAAAWLTLDSSHRDRIFFAAASVLGLAFGWSATRYQGKWVNHWFELIVVVSIAAAVAWSRFDEHWMRARWPHAWILGLLPIVILGADPLAVPGKITALRNVRVESEAAEARFRDDVDYLRARSGPAICENLSLCYFAGKPRDYEPYNARQRILMHPEAAQAIVDALASHRYATVQIDAEPGERLTATDRLRFPAQFMKALLENYHVGSRNSERVFFVPNSQ